jgi:lipoprotein-anchoring transpeptidase ErfK/SrfK
MLRTRVVAMACLVILPSAAARAEATKVDPNTSLNVGVPAIALPAISLNAAAAEAPKFGAEGVTIAQPTATTDAKTAAAHTGNAAPSVQPTLETAKVDDTPQAPAVLEPTLIAMIDLATQRMEVSEDGVEKYSWPISSGTSEFPTPRGTFRPQWVAKMWYSRKYDNAPMPNAVFINGGVAVHATPHVSRLGTPASHGCIRLSPVNAKIFYGLVQKHGMKMTKVSVFGTPKWHSPAVASRKAPRPQRYASAAHDDSGWLMASPKKYQAASAFDHGFVKQKRYRPLPPPGYVYVNPPQPRIYRAPNGQRYVYVQRPQRRAYYYNTSGYGYGGGW